MLPDDRRKNTRVSFQAIADVRFQGIDYTLCGTRNLSISSVYILGIDEQTAGARCEIDLHLTGATSDLILKMKGEVARCAEDGVILRFYETDLDSYHYLKNIIYYNAENPEEFDEQFPGHILHPSIN